MSPHVQIGRDLDDLAHPNRSALEERRVEECIIKLFRSCVITAEEFHYYCERFRRVTTRELRRVA